MTVDRLTGRGMVASLCAQLTHSSSAFLQGSGHSLADQVVDPGCVKVGASPDNVPNNPATRERALLELSTAWPSTQIQNPLKLARLAMQQSAS
jgi:hypothetical protein